MIPGLTILRWHRQLIARKWTPNSAKAGPCGVDLKDLATLIVRMAMENPGWGYTRIQGALKNLGHGVARSIVAKVLKTNGLPAAPDRPSSWRTFLRAHWGVIAGADFFTMEVWTPYCPKTPPMLRPPGGSSATGHPAVRGNERGSHPYCPKTHPISQAARW